MRPGTPSFAEYLELVEQLYKTSSQSLALVTQMVLMAYETKNDIPGVLRLLNVTETNWNNINNLHDNAIAMRDVINNMEEFASKGNMLAVNSVYQKAREAGLVCEGGYVESAYVRLYNSSSRGIAFGR
ncbi:MAG: hypothetical protein P1U34_12340 [Coxiellaceae bacterium]|nr:hypothetical protein [Coxiellaceae bacterium]